MKAISFSGRLSIRARVILLAVAAVAGLGLVGVVGFFSDRVIQSADVKYEKANAAFSALSDLQQRLQKLRIEEQALRNARKAEFLAPVSARLASAADAPALLSADRMVVSAFEDYTGALAEYQAVLERIGYRDRMSVEVEEQGQAGINSPTGQLVELSNTISKIEARVSEELEFDDQTAVYETGLAFQKLRLSLQKLLALSETDYLPTITSGISELASLVENPDLDPDFSETAAGLLSELQERVETLGGSEASIAALTGTVNDSYRRLEAALSDNLEETTAEAGRIRSALLQTKTAASRAIQATLIVTFLVLAAASFLIVRSISGNLKAITGATSDFARGHFERDVPLTDAATEIGELARALLVFKENALQKQQLENDVENEIALKTERQAKTSKTIEAFRREIVVLLEATGDKVGQSRMSAEKLQSASRRNTEQAVSANEASQSSSQTVQTIANSAQQLSSSISEISSQVNTTSDQIRKVSETAQSTNTDVEQLANASAKIDEIIVLIQAIAEQTNLLALNATIEAARAGEHGKGFSVVASEVKSLAEQTAKATDEISAQIKSIQSSSGAAVTAMAEIAALVADAQSNTSAIAEAVEKQSLATSDINQNISQAADGTQHMAETVSGLLSTVSEADQSATEIHRTSDEITEMTADLNRRIENFLNEVAAA
jgi:methyl-accepting chemotaxis protein